MRSPTWAECQGRPARQRHAQRERGAVVDGLSIALGFDLDDAAMQLHECDRSSPVRCRCRWPWW